jgi:16S rRNA (guanine966-N2)-methyltransferase
VAGVRVVAGEARGRLLRAPSGRVTRPTSDRVREAMFDIVGSLLDIGGATVVDLFAGSGALGIEARSRGAATVTFVERDREALASLQANLESLGFARSGATVVAADARQWVTGPRPRADVVFADPPYSFDGWASLLAAMAPWADLVVAETGAPLEVPPEWVVARQRRYGATVVTVARPAPRSDGHSDAKGGM